MLSPLLLKQGGVDSTRTPFFSPRVWISVFSFQFSVFGFRISDRLLAGLFWLFDNLVVREENVPLRGVAIV